MKNTEDVSYQPRPPVFPPVCISTSSFPQEAGTLHDQACHLHEPTSISTNISTLKGQKAHFFVSKSHKTFKVNKLIRRKSQKKARVYENLINKEFTDIIKKITLKVTKTIR